MFSNELNLAFDVVENSNFNCIIIETCIYANDIKVKMDLIRKYLKHC